MNQPKTRGELWGVAGRYFLPALLFAAIAWIRYGGYIPRLHVDFDDFRNVLANPYVKDFSNAVYLLSSGYFSVFWEPDYHPLSTFFYFIDYFFFGLTPSGYKLANLFFLVLNSLLVYGLARRFLKENPFALVAGCLYLVHPIHTIDFISSVSTNHLMMTTFYLAAFACHLRSHEAKAHPAWTALTCLSYLSSVLCKQTGILLPLLLVLYDVLLARADWAVHKRRYLIEYLCLVLVGMGYWIAYSIIFRSQDFSGPLRYYWPTPFWLPASRFCAALSRLFNTDAHLGSVPISAVLFVGVVAWECLHRSFRVPVFFGAWIFVSLLPFLNVLPIAQIQIHIGFMDISERYLFPAAAAFCLLMAAAFKSCCDRIRFGKKIAWIVLGCAVLASMAGGPGLPWRWGSDSQKTGAPLRFLDLDSYGRPLRRLLVLPFVRQKHPELFHPMAQELLRGVPTRETEAILRYFGDGDAYHDAHAARYFVRVLGQILPLQNRPNQDPAAPLNNERAFSRKLQQDVAQLERAVGFYERGKVCLQKGEYSLALTKLDQAIREDESYAEAYLQKAYAYVRMGSLPDAIASYRRAREIDAAVAAQFCKTHHEICGRSSSL